MDKKEFIDTCEVYLDKTGMSDGSWNSFMSIGDEKDINTSLYVDENGYLWVSRQESVRRVKTSININNVVEFRYDQFGKECAERFFIICNDYSGLDFCQGEIGFFENGDFGHFEDAVTWFINHSVD